MSDKAMPSRIGKAPKKQQMPGEAGKAPSCMTWKGGSTAKKK